MLDILKLMRQMLKEIDSHEAKKAQIVHNKTISIKMSIRGFERFALRGPLGVQSNLVSYKSLSLPNKLMKNYGLMMLLTNLKIDKAKRYNRSVFGICSQTIKEGKSSHIG